MIAPRTPASRCSPLTAMLVTFGFFVLQPKTMGASRTGCLPDAALDSEGQNSVRLVALVARQFDFSSPSCRSESALSGDDLRSARALSAAYDVNTQYSA